MAALSLSRAWDQSRDVLRRDGQLLGTVALALFVLPGVVGDMVTPPHPPGQMAPMGYWTAISFLGLLIGLVGQLAVVRLALGPRHSVGEAIRHGVRRLPAYLGASALWIFPFLIAISLLLAQAPDPQKPPPAVALGVLILLAGFAFLAVRLILTVGVSSAETGASPYVLKRSWALSRGNALRLLAFLLLVLVAFFVLVLAISAVMGSIVRLTIGAIEPYSVSALLVSIVGQLIAAGITTTLMVMLARIYAQLSGHETTASGLPQVHVD